jgi:hypothetical protein
MTDDRIAALERQINAAQVELQALKAGKTAPRPPVKDVREVSVTAVLDERTDLPDLKQLAKLFDVVRNLVPEVRSYDRDAALRGFAGAFRYVSNCGRLAAPNGKLGLGYFMDDMKQWLRHRNAMTIDVTGSSFLGAVLASGDICFVPHNSMLGHVFEVGLQPPFHGGKPANADGWKRILREGASAVLPPSAPARRMAAPSPVRIYGG